MERKKLDFIEHAHYEISEYGDLRSLKMGKYYLFQKNSCKVSRDGKKYVNYMLAVKKGSSKRYLAHRLVARAFLNLDINNTKLFACHKDDNPENNHYTNLFIGDTKMNQEDMARKFRALHKLTPQDVLCIIKLIEHGVSQRECSRRFEVSPPVINKIWKQRHIYDFSLIEI